MNILSQIKVFVWRLIFTPYYRVRFYVNQKNRNQLHVLNSVDTILYIIKNKCSVSRFGDGEFQMITHCKEHGTQENFHVDTFQSYDAKLAQRLQEVYDSNLPNHLICIPYALKDSSIYKGYTRTFFERELLLRENILRIGNNITLMGDACFTRFYLDRQDIKNYRFYSKLLREIWNNRRLFIVEGEKSRLGVGNDLFDNTLEIHRLLCPTTNAFGKYDEIMAAIIKKITCDDLILIALGHTATVLAYDLSKLGYQAIDIGHIDIEYEWLRMGAKRKMPVPNKYVNEVREGRIDTDLNDVTYQSQIIGRIS